MRSNETRDASSYYSIATKLCFKIPARPVLYFSTFKFGRQLKIMVEGGFTRRLYDVHASFCSDEHAQTHAKKLAGAQHQ